MRSTATVRSMRMCGIAAVMLAACGSGGEAEVRAPAVQQNTGTIATTSPTVPPTTTNPPPTIPPPTEAPADATSTDSLQAPCDTDRRLLEEAIESFHTANERFPINQQMLVILDLMPAEMGSFDMSTDGLIERIAGEPCLFDDVGLIVDDGTLHNVDSVLDEFGPDIIAGFGGIDCAMEVARIVVASDSYRRSTGLDAETIDVLGPFLDEPITLWTWDDERSTVVPSPGSGCIDPNVAQPTSDCGDRRHRLELIVAEYAATNGIPTTAGLVERDYVMETDKAFDIIDGAVVPTGVDGCDELVSNRPPSTLTSERCRLDGRILSTAAEAYNALFDTNPASEFDLVAFELLRTISPWYDLDGTAVVPVPNGDCASVTVDNPRDDPPADEPADEPADADTTRSDGGIDQTTELIDRCEDEGVAALETIRGYYAMYGEYPDDEQALLDSGLLLRELDHYDVAFGDIIPLDGCPYPEW